MRTRNAMAGIGFVLSALLLARASPVAAEPFATAGQAGSGLDPAYLDQLLAPVALYPDQLLAQILLCSGNSSKVTEFSGWLKANSHRKGSELQQAAQDAGFEPSFIALAPFPQVVDMMARDLRWTSALGGAFLVDRDAVFDSIQRLRGKSQAAGNLKTTPQQKVEQRTTQSGEQVIVIEPANPQVVYVPQYNPQVVYTQAAPATTTTTVVVKEDDDDEDEAAAAGALVGFAAGIAIGAAFDNSYYYGPYGWHGGGAYMYSGGWDDWYDDREDAREDFYDNREDAREDWQDHREDMGGERSERAEDAREQRTERTEQRTEQRGERSGTAQEQRTERQQNRGGSEAQAQREQRRSEAQASRGSGERSQARAERSGTRSDAFSGYSSGTSTRSASSRGSRSRSGGGGGRGGRRR
jgi:hypothetical protein